MDPGNNEVLKFKPQVILKIVITEVHTDKIICPTKLNCFSCDKDRYDLLVLMHELGSVTTEEIKHDHKE